MKYCPRCETTKSLDEFPRNGVAGVYAYCKPCKSQYEHERNLRDPGGNFIRNLRVACKRVGITLDDYYSTHAEQAGLCAICKREADRERFCIDHDHDTMQFRGLLCSACNLALGHFENNTEFLKNAITYLERG